VTGVEITSVDSFFIVLIFFLEVEGYLLKCSFEIRVEWTVVERRQNRRPATI